MKSILIITSLILNIAVFGQTQSNKIPCNYKLLGLNKLTNVKAIKNKEDFNYYLVIKSKSKTDSICFDHDQNNWSVDTCIINSKQLDGKGKPELIITCTKTSQEFSQSSDGYSVVQIWNLDTKTLMFKGSISWNSSSEEIVKDTCFDCWETHTVAHICDGYYDIDFDDKGHLIIKNLIVHVINSEFCKSDHEEGLYELVNGIYILTTKTNGK